VASGTSKVVLDCIYCHFIYYIAKSLHHHVRPKDFWDVQGPNSLQKRRNKFVIVNNIYFYFNANKNLNDIDAKIGVLFRGAACISYIFVLMRKKLFVLNRNFITSGSCFVR